MDVNAKDSLRFRQMQTYMLQPHKDRNIAHPQEHIYE